MTQDHPRYTARLERVRAVKRDIVIEAARRVFEAQGLDGASMRQIAREAGCTTGAIYPYFAGKEEIYAEILSQSLADLAAYIDAASGMSGAGPIDRARAAALAFHGYYARRPGELSLGLYLFRQAGLKPAGLSPVLDESLNAELVAVIDRIADAIDAAGLTPARILAVEAVSHAVGLVIMRETGRLRLFDADAGVMMQNFIERLLPEAPTPLASKIDA
jgi:AcrR family transcriptional regulator